MGKGRGNFWSRRLGRASLLLDLPRPFFAQLADAMTRQQGIGNREAKKLCGRGSSHHDMEEEEVAGKKSDGR